MTLVEKIVKTAPIEIDDNYKLRLQARCRILNMRREKLCMCNCRGQIEYENGMAARFYPNVHYRKDFPRLSRMIKEIDKELREINKYL